MSKTRLSLPARLARAALMLSMLGGAAGILLGETAGISKVSVSRPFFNPSLGERMRIVFTAAKAGEAIVQILDRDGFLVRTVAKGKKIPQGESAFEWDGRDDSGEIVPDEAYSVKIDLASGGRVETYFPALAAGEAGEEVKAETNYYDRHGATFSYKLPRASRVHIQAGVAQVNPTTKKPEGPVLKTLVNREARPAGSVVENWNGFDEGGTFYVPDLPHFVVSIAATTLPENAILATGNRTRTFLERAAVRTGASLLPAPQAEHFHHRGLSALDDAAPRLKAAPLNATWSAAERVWRPMEKSVKVSLELQGPSAGAFERQPTAAYVFVDKSKVATIRSPHAGDTLSVPLTKLSPGSHIVAINWASSYGPVAIDVFRVVVGKATSLQPAAFK